MPKEKTTKVKLLEEFNEFTKTLEADFITEGYSAYGDLEDFISQTIDRVREETIKEVEKILPEKRLGQVNNEGFCEDCHYKLCRCSEFNYLIDFIKQSLKSLINKLEI